MDNSVKRAAFVSDDCASAIKGHSGEFRAGWILDIAQLSGCMDHAMHALAVKQPTRVRIDRSLYRAPLADTHHVRLFVETGQLERESVWSRTL